MRRRHIARYQKRGSLALFFCLVMAAAVLYMGIFLQSARLRAAEHDLTRAMSSQIQTCLASYDEECRPFGLFGFLADTPDQSVFAACLPQGMQVTNVRLIPLKPLTDSDVLSGQITRYMKSRLPAVLLSELLGRLDCFGQVFSQSLPKDAGTGMTEAKMLLSGQDSDSFSSLLQSFSADIRKSDLCSAAESLFGGALDQLADQTMSQLESTYRQYAAEYAGIRPNGSISDVEDAVPDFLDPSSISSIAGNLEKILDFQTAPVYEKICLVEYILGQFRPSVEVAASQSGTSPLQTLDGRAYKSMPDARKAEVEQILTGKNNPVSACRITRSVLTGIRSLIHLAALLCDKEQRSILQGTATALTAAVAVFSGGAVIIDPKVMFYLVAAGKAIEAGASDYKHLAAGKAVGLWPGQPGEIISLYYQDYLRLFLHFIPQKQLLSRVSGQIARILPGQRYTSLQMMVDFRRKTVQLTGGYHE